MNQMRVWYGSSSSMRSGDWHFTHALTSSPKSLRSNYQPSPTQFKTGSANPSELCLSCSVYLVSLPSVTLPSSVAMWRRHALSVCSGARYLFFLLLHCNVACLRTVWVLVCCALSESFKLIKDMIYRSTLLEELPDRSSNRRDFSNELSPLNHRQPQGSNWRPRHTCTVYAEGGYPSTVHPHSWTEAVFLTTNQCPYISESLSGKCQCSMKLDYLRIFELYCTAMRLGKMPLVLPRYSSCMHL